MISFKTRVEQDELMDDPAIGFEEFAETLRQLEEINGTIDSYRPTLQALEFFWKMKQGALTRPSGTLSRGEREMSSSPLKILDIGCGYGDMLRAVRRWAVKKKIPVALTGIDLNPHSGKAAASATSPEMEIQYLTGDIFDFNPEQKFHVIINSLFTHHLRNAQIAAVMRWMSANAQLGWFINDLHRHWIAYHFIKYYVKFRNYNRLIQNDAPLSVARSFLRQDWQHLVTAAGLPADRVKIEWHWPFRYGVRYAV